MQRPKVHVLPKLTLAERFAGQSPFLERLLAPESDATRGDADELEDPAAREHIRALFRLVANGFRAPLPIAISDYLALAHIALTRPVALTRWSGLPATYFMAGALLDRLNAGPQHARPVGDIAVWYFTSFATTNDHDRFVTDAQKRRLLGPSDIPGVSLIARLLWLGHHPGGAGDRASMARWFAETDAGSHRLPYLDRVDIAPVPQRVAEPAAAATPAARDLAPSELVSFCRRGNSHRYCLPATWHPSEPSCRWSKDGTGLFAFSLGQDPGPAYLDVDLVVEAAAGAPVRLALTLNGRTLVEAVDGRGGARRLVLPIEDRLRTGAFYNILGFHAHPASNPAHGTEGGPGRGIGVERLWIGRRI